MGTSKIIRLHISDQFIWVNPVSPAGFFFLPYSQCLIFSIPLISRYIPLSDEFYRISKAQPGSLLSARRYVLHIAGERASHIPSDTSWGNRAHRQTGRHRTSPWPIWYRLSLTEHTGAADYRPFFAPLRFPLANKICHGQNNNRTNLYPISGFYRGRGCSRLNEKA